MINSGFRIVKFWKIALVPLTFVPVKFVATTVVGVINGVVIDVKALSVDVMVVVPDRFVPVKLVTLRRFKVSTPPTAV